MRPFERTLSGTFPNFFNPQRYFFYPFFKLIINHLGLFKQNTTRCSYGIFQKKRLCIVFP